MTSKKQKDSHGTNSLSRDFVIAKGYLPTIGLEVHIQLNQKRKMFTPEAVTYGETPNTYTSPITLAHPGTLPFPNKGAIFSALKMGLACGSKITKENRFSRKNYYYADLPKGYQITQNETPLCVGGAIPITTSQGQKQITLTHIHLEEDTGKSTHAPQAGVSLLDYNRAGTPLIEVVTEPCFTHPEEVSQFLLAVRRLVRYLGVSNGNMEEGSLRCDVNISIRQEGDPTLGTKVEVKNLNSRRHAAAATRYEVERQSALRVAGQAIIAETRSYDPLQEVTSPLRKKEGKTDYRYFEEPNLSPFVIDDATLEKVKATLPILPHVLYEKLLTTYKLSPAHAITLTESKAMGLFFEEVAHHSTHYQLIANFIIGPIKSFLNEEKITLADLKLVPTQLASLVNLIAEEKITFSIGTSEILPLLWKGDPRSASQIAQEKGLLQIHSDDAILGWVEHVLKSYPDKVAAYRSGKKGLLGFFMGQVMRESQQKANPKAATALLKAKLEATS